MSQWSRVIFVQVSAHTRSRRDETLPTLIWTGLRPKP